VANTQTAGGTGQNPERQRRAAAAAEDGGGAAILLRDAKRAIAPYNVRPFGGRAAENSRTSAIAGPGRLPSDRPLEGRGRGLTGIGSTATGLLTSMEGKCSYPSAVAGKRKRSTSSGASCIRKRCA